MAFGHQSGPTRNWKFGCRVVGDDGELIDILRGANHYRNKLCELELVRREKVEQIIVLHAPDFAAAKEAWQQSALAVEKATKAVASYKAEHKTNRLPPGHRLASGLKSAKQVRSARYERLKALKSEVFERLKVRGPLDQADAADRDAKKRARRDCGLHWATYLTIEQSCGSFGRGVPPRFRRFDGGGKLAVQIQKGMQVGQWAHDGHRDLSIDALPLAPNHRAREEAQSHGGQWEIGKRRAAKPIFQLNFRVGVTVDRRPRHARITAEIHRPLPQDARIKWAFLVARRIATDTRWHLVFSLERAGGWHSDDTHGVGEVSVDLGWRKMPSGNMRVAYWMSGDGESGELILPRQQFRRLEKSDSLRSIRDRNFGPALRAVVQFAKQCDHLPDWWGERTNTLSHWRSPAQLASLIIHWRDRRLDGDDDAFEAAEAWRKQDKHLYLWECHNRRKFRGFRTNLYRNFARSLRRKFGRLLIEDVDWTAFARKPSIEESDEDGHQRARQKIASPGELQRILLECFGADAEKKSARYVTMRCHQCGLLCGQKQRKALVYECRQCGSTWDQDRNACAN